MKTAGRFRPAGILICVMVFLYFAGRCFDCTVDDAFVTMRYAQNFAAGHGLVFNGDERVEGFSNPLWILLLSVFAGWSLDLLMTVKIIGILCWIATLIVSLWSARKHFDVSPGLTYIMGAYLATSFGLVYFSVAGLETIFYALLILLMNHFLLEKRMLAASIMTAAVIFTRPEGVLYFFPFAAFLVVNRKQVRNRYLILLLPVAAALFLYAARILYYGEILPNTFYVKIHPNQPLPAYMFDHLLILIRYTYESLTTGGVTLVFAVFYLAFFKQKKHLAVILSLTMAMFFIWFGSYDWMPFGRFYQPVLPLMIVSAFAGLEKLKQTLSELRCRPWLIYAWLLLPVGFNAVDAHYRIRALHAGEQVNPAMHSKQHVVIGCYLREIGMKHDGVVTNETGAIGYYSEMHIIDMIGLTDKKIPRLLRRNALEEYADYIFLKNPRFVLLNDRQSPTDEEMHPYHKVLYIKMMQMKSYELRKQFALNSYKNVLLFERNN